MKHHPRFQAEYFIRENLEQLKVYGVVFRERIVRAFEKLDEEAHRVQEEHYAELASSNPYQEEDDSRISEEAYFKGVDFYLATDAIRQGVVNLMIAGLFHLFEQQADFLTKDLPQPASEYKGQSGWERLQHVLKEMGIKVESFKSANLMTELLLVANTVKHGPGRSSEKLKQINPSLFATEWDSNVPNFQRPLKPLTGEGLRLNESHFDNYFKSMVEFWTELTDALFPILGPKG